MPLFYWKCAYCDHSIARICSFIDSKKEHICIKCGLPMIRDYKGINSQSYETLDNGLMSKKVERLADAHRLNDEHIKTDPFKDK